MALDEIDLLIFEELKTDARQPVRALARKLELKRSTVRYRLDRLISEGILRIICTGHTEYLGYKVLTVIGVKTRSDRTDAVADHLTSLETVKNVCLSAGRYNIVAWAIFRDESDLSDFITQDLADISDISSIEIMQCFQWLKAFFEPNEVRFPASAPSQVSDLDLSLIKALQQDPRQTITKLAETLGCSQAATRNRLNKLINEGIIRFIPLIDPMTRDSVNAAVILIKPELDKVNDVVSKLSSLKMTMFLCLMTGQWQIMAVAQFQDGAHVYESIMDALSVVPGVSEFEIVPLLQSMKFIPAII